MKSDSKDSVQESRIWRALEQVMDPEIPVVSVVDLGIVRRVSTEGRGVSVTITPTFAGCPALEMMKEEIEAGLGHLGLDPVVVDVSYQSAWTSDRISEEGRAKLRAFGLAPPPQHGGSVELVLEEPAVCPYCGSDATKRTNTFGSTLCRSIHYCTSCQQPFESFKPL